MIWSVPGPYSENQLHASLQTCCANAWHPSSSLLVSSDQTAVFQYFTGLFKCSAAKFVTSINTLFLQQWWACIPWWLLDVVVVFVLNNCTWSFWIFLKLSTSPPWLLGNSSGNSFQKSLKHYTTKTDCGLIPSRVWLSTSGESFMSIAPSEIYLLRRIATYSILVFPAWCFQMFLVCWFFDLPSNHLHLGLQHISPDRRLSVWYFTYDIIHSLCSAFSNFLLTQKLLLEAKLDVQSS